MNRYEEMHTRHQASVNALPLKFAFSNEQFERAMAELGLKPTDTDKIYKLGVGGGFYRRTDAELVRKTFEDNSKELEAAIAADKTGTGFIYEMFLYELRNHEYGYTGDTEDALDALGYTYEDLEKDKRLDAGLRKACKQIQNEEW